MKLHGTIIASGLLWTLLLLHSNVVLLFVSAESTGVLELHGSGTSNPSKCFWSIMESLTEEAGVPVRLTYRSIGSSSGITEFSSQFVSSAESNGSTNSRIYFASGDIPIAADIFANLTQDGTNLQFMHLPVVAGAVSFFHNVPLGSAELSLNLTACVLAQIYTQTILSWGDAQITELNPNLPDDVKDLSITVARRLDGSSSTESSTKYMRSACSDPTLQLPENLVGVLPDWPLDVGLKICDGSSGMTECIKSTNGTIGYIDYGHGASAGLSEVRLQVAGAGDNEFRHSQDSVVNAAVTRDKLPATPDLDHSNVTFLNGAGAETWPIVQMTYVYVRKNLTAYIGSPQEQSLLIAFLRSLYTESYINRCAEDYGFTVMTNASIPDVYSYAMTAIDELEQSASSTSVPWKFENKETLKIEGAGPYIFSAKRHVQLKEIKARLDDLESVLTGTDADEPEGGTAPATPDTSSTNLLTDLQAQINELRADLEALDGSTSTGGSNVEQEGQSRSSTSSEQSATFTSSNETQLKAAVALSSISFLLWMLWIAAYIARCLRSGGSSSTMG